jgi:hypothetical protein
MIYDDADRRYLVAQLTGFFVPSTVLPLSQQALRDAWAQPKGSTIRRSSERCFLESSL